MRQALSAPTAVVRDDELHEIRSPITLQPGPAVLIDSLDASTAIVRDWSSRASAVDAQAGVQALEEH